MTVELTDHRVRAWLEAAKADARRRALPDLVPLLEQLGLAMAAVYRLDMQGETCSRPPHPGGQEQAEP